MVRSGLRLAAAVLACAAGRAWGGPGLPLAGRETEPAPADAPAEFVAQARMLFHVAACGAGGEIPLRFDGGKVLEHCRKMEDLISGFRGGWLAQARAYLSPLRPKDLPRAVVYPFGGGDLVSALAAFPEADEYTLASLEPAGDPRTIDSVDMAGLDRSFSLLERGIGRQFKVGHNRTDEMAAAASDRLPSQLLYALVALVAHGYEPVSLKYFDLAADGGLSYLMPGALPEPGKTGRGGPSSFRNMELSFRLSGPGPAGRVRVLRHISWDLSDRNLRKNPGLLRHLSAKGQVAAMTKAASYLLWEDSFSMIRDYLLRNMAWMISDSTGIPARHAQAAGFVQDAYGRFEGPFLRAAPGPARDFAALWKSQPLRRLPFAFGYPDANHHLHLLVTRRPTPGEAAPSPASAPPSARSPEARYTDAALGFSVSFSSPAFIKDASPGSEDRFLRLQNFVYDDGQKSLSLDEGSFRMEFLSAKKGVPSAYDRLRADWGSEVPMSLDGFPCRRFSGYRRPGASSPFSPDSAVLCPGTQRDILIMTFMLARCAGPGTSAGGPPSSACRSVDRILESIRLDPAVFGR